MIGQPNEVIETWLNYREDGIIDGEILRSNYFLTNGQQLHFKHSQIGRTIVWEGQRYKSMMGFWSPAFSLNIPSPIFDYDANGIFEHLHSLDFVEPCYYHRSVRIHGQVFKWWDSNDWHHKPIYVPNANGVFLHFRTGTKNDGVLYALHKQGATFLRAYHAESLIQSVWYKTVEDRLYNE